MKSLIIIGLLGLSLNAKPIVYSVEENMKMFDRLSNNQKLEIYKAYLDGVKYDLGFSFAGITWKESLGNLIDINLQDPSCGKFHNNIKSVMARHPEIRDTGFNKNKICSRFQRDNDFAVQETKAELLYWKKYHKGNWRKIYGSYNGGHVGNKYYAQDIINKIKAFKKSITKFEKLHNIKS